MTALSKTEILNRIYNEQLYLDCLQKDYEDNFTRMSSEQHLRRQSNISLSMQTLASLNNELRDFNDMSSAQKAVENLIFETNKEYHHEK